MKHFLIVTLGCFSAFVLYGADSASESPVDSTTPTTASQALSESGTATVPPARPRPPQYIPQPTGTPATPPTDPSKFEIFLLVGQSNMAGRGVVGEADKIADPHVLVLNCADQWVTEGEPIHFDKPAAGVGPGYTFAKLLAARKPGVTIGLIPCAFGGTGLQGWHPEARDRKLYPPYTLFENAVRRAQIAMRSGTLKGILWHQGESDATPRSAGVYAAHLAPIVASFRKSLSPDVPFIAGEIGYFGYDLHPEYKTVNEQIDTLPTIIPNCAVVSADGLVDKGDHAHFNTESQKLLAQRYFDAYLKLEGASKKSTSSTP